MMREEIKFGISPLAILYHNAPCDRDYSSIKVRSAGLFLDECGRSCLMGCRTADLCSPFGVPKCKQQER